MPGPRKRSLQNGTYAAGSLGEVQPRKYGGFSRLTPCRLTPHRFIAGEAHRVCTVCGHVEPLEPASAVMVADARRKSRPPAPPVPLFHCKLCGQNKPAEAMLMRHGVVKTDRRGICHDCAADVRRALGK